MSIENKDWHAQDDKMPGVNTFKVSGIVTVPNSAVDAVLVRSTTHGANNYVILDLKLNHRFGEQGLQVLTERQVTYTQPSGSDINGVAIYHDGELLVDINEVLVTH